MNQQHHHAAGQEAVHFLSGLARRTKLPVWRICFTRADGTTGSFERVGGSTIDHSLDGMERAGLGGVVRVTPVELGQLEGEAA